MVLSLVEHSFVDRLFKISAEPQNFLPYEDIDPSNAFKGMRTLRICSAVFSIQF